MNVIITVVCAALWPPFVASSVDNNPPCFMNDDNPPAFYPPVLYLINKIRVPILNLSAVLKERLKEMEHLCTAEPDYSFMAYYLGEKYRTPTCLFSFLRLFATDQSVTIMAIREHYDILNTLAHYLQVIRKTAADITALESLVSIQENIYKVMCVMKTTLRSIGHDPESKVPSGLLSDNFYENVYDRPGVCLQQQLEYVIVNDCYKFTFLLDEFYNNAC